MAAPTFDDVQFTSAPASAAPATPEAPNPFAQGLRSSITSTRGEASALLGRGAETLGLPATDQYARSAELERQAQTELPRITSADQVHSPEDALDYGAGLAGRSVVPVALGLAGGAFGRGTAGRIVGATLATMPSTVAGQVQAQQEDPVQAATPVGERNKVALAAGGAQALAANVVPQVLGGKLVGAVGGKAAGEGVSSILARNLAEGVGGNAAAGAASARIGQVAADELNPNRDTSGDAAALKEAAISGGALGLPFAALGTAGEAVRAPRAPIPGREPVNLDAGKAPSTLDNIRQAIAPGKPVGETEQAAKIAVGGDLLDDAKLATAAPDEAARMIDEGDRTVLSKVSDWAKELYTNSDALTPAAKASLDAAATNLTDKGNQAIVAGLKVAQDGLVKAKDLGQRLASSFGEPADATRSEADAGPSQAVAGALVDAGQDPQTAAAYARGVAATIDHASTTGELPARGLAALQATFGDDARRVLTAVHDQVAGDDPARAERFHQAMRQLDEHSFSETSLRDTVTGAMKPELRAQLDGASVQQLIDGIRQYVSGDAVRNKGRTEAELHNTDIRRALIDTFGAKTDDVIARFAEDHSRRQPKLVAEKETATPRESSEPSQAELASRDRELSSPDHLGEAQAFNPADAVETRYVGGGKDQGAPKYVERPDVHRAKFGNEGPAERLLKETQARFPDRAVDYISARDHARATGMDEAALMKATDGRPNDHVLIEARGAKTEGRMTADEVDAVRLDSKKYPDSKSRIDTGKAGETFDAVRLMQAMKKKLGYTAADEVGGRDLRAFQEGVAALSDHVGKNIEFSDATVVDRRGTTVGDLKKIRTDTATESQGRGDRLDTTKTEAQHAAEMGRANQRLEDLKAQAEPLIAKEKAGTLSPIERAKLDKLRNQATFEQRAYSAAERATQRLNAEPAEMADRAVEETRTPTKVDDKGSLLKADNTISRLGREQVASRASELAAGKSAISRTLGSKLAGLDGRLADMTPAEQQRLLRVAKPGADIMKTSEVINELATKYPATETKASLASRAETAPDEVIANVKKSSDYGSLKDSISKLLNAKRSDNIDRVVDAMNDRVEALLRDNPQAQYDYLREHMRSGINATRGLEMTPAERTAFEQHIAKVLGPSVDVQFAKLLHAGEFEKVDKSMAPNAKDIIRVSVHSLDPEGVAYHESMHAFMSQLRDSGDHNINRVLFTAADTHVVRSQLRELLKNSPEALKQIEASAEERAAYMYQFHQQGALKLGPKTESVLNKLQAFFRRVLGIWSNDDRALHVMDYFQSGEYAKNIGDRSAIREALNQGVNPRLEATKSFLKPARDLAASVVAVGESRLRDTNIPGLVKLADLVHTPTSRDAAGGDVGYIQAAREQYTRSINDLAKSLKGLNVDQLNEALESLQSGKRAVSAEGQAGAKVVRAALDRQYDYMTSAGVKLGDLGYGRDYFPRVWSSDTITRNQAAFKAMLQKYKDSGELNSPVDQVMARLIRNGGSELGVERVMPGMQHSKERVLGFIQPEDAAPFLSKDLYGTLNSYIQQAARKAEWVRRFGHDNEKIDQLFKSAEKDGATTEDLAVARKYLNGVNGTLGDNINPTARRLFSNTLVYQNVRLLSLGIFSSAPDAAGIFVRGGTVGDAFSTFKRGIAEIGRGFKDPANRKNDAGYNLAEDLGVIDSAMLQHTVGSAYSQDLGGFAKKVNEGFFRYNLMDQYNRSMRVGATVAAGRFLARHADATASPHSERWLAELGLKAGDVIVKNGEPLLTEQHFLDAGYSAEEAAVRGNQMAAAVNKWVDGAVLRPNAAQKPIWFNDPHFALISHLKQFVYSFQENILKRVINEAKYGNYTPALGLASYVPIMIAADAAKGLIQGGGNVPSWKDNWGPGEYFWSGVQRAGLLGAGQFGADALSHGAGSVLGPTLEQFGGAINVAGGRERFGNFVLKSMPANATYAALAGGVASDPTFAD